MSYNLSVLIPGIRTHHWRRVVESLKLACSKYRYEVVFTGPFPPEDYLGRDVKWIESWDTIPVTMQKATIALSGELVFHTTDDSVFANNSLDAAVGRWYYENGMTGSVLGKVIVNCRYKEGGNFSGLPLPLEFWRAGYHGDLQIAGVDPKWQISLQPLMLTDYFRELGGFDCRYEYSNHCHHDLLFRMQMDGAEVFQSPTEVASADHFPGTTGDHSPIHYAQQEDQKLFEQVYRNKEYQIIIDYDNYKDYEGDWKRRFPRRFKSYKEMMGSLV